MKVFMPPSPVWHARRGTSVLSGPRLRTRSRARTPEKPRGDATRRMCAGKARVKYKQSNKNARTGRAYTYREIESSAVDMVVGAACAQLLVLHRTRSGLALLCSGVGDLAMPMVLLPLEPE